MSKTKYAKKELRFTLSESDKCFLKPLIDVEGKLKNFWLDTIVSRPQLMTVSGSPKIASKVAEANANTLLRYYAHIDYEIRQCIL